MGRHHARVYANLPETVLVGVVDNDPERAESLAEQFGCKVFFSVEQLIQAGVDIASIAVPTTHHRAAAEPLLRAGVACLVEKPLAGDVSESKLIKKLRNRGFSTFTLALIALGTTDILFALDSIPAIFGLTRDPYIVFMANAFALMGLRQLYFLVGILLRRLIYLSKGLAVVLGFIGVKLVIEALHGVGVHSIGPVEVPHISLNFSLGVIISALAVTAIISLRKNPSEPDPRDHA